MFVVVVVVVFWGAIEDVRIVAGGSYSKGFSVCFVLLFFGGGEGY